MNNDGTEHFHRLGKRELGRHAFEEHMPDRIAKIISNEDDQNTVTGVIPKLAQLLRRDPDVEAAYLCTENAVQVHKLPDEGAHFCGYRNIQMLCLAIGLSGHYEPGGIDFRRKLGVPLLQDLIERAWGRDLNAHGRIQTGGIKGTRKHVGTSEAETLLLSLDVSCTGSAFEGKDAWSELLDSVEKYFSTAITANAQKNGLHGTSRMPIFLQRPRHSVTIVGLERLRSGKRRLLIFDPAWRPPSMDCTSTEATIPLSWKELLSLRRYRKSERYLKRFSAFETLVVGV